MRRFLTGFFERFRVLLRRNRFESDLDAELRFHTEEATRRNIERGMSPRDANIAARRSLGRTDVTKDLVRKETGVHAILSRVDAWFLDFKLGFRMLVKYPGLTLAGGLAMAVAIAISLGFASAFDSFLYTPPILKGVVTVRSWNMTIGRRHAYGASLRDYVRWRDELQSVDNLSAFRHYQQRDLITADGRGDPVNSAEMSPSAFRVFRAPPLMGRFLVDDDAREGAPPVVVVSHDIWRTHFGSDPDVVGRDVRLGGSVFTIVGVMPEGFAYPVKHKLWTPLKVDQLQYEGDETHVEIFGRLSPRASLEGARAELSAVGMLESMSLTDNRDDIRPGFVDYATRHTNVEDTPPRAAQMMRFFFALLLLVPCANVAILVYARTARRQGEMAVRNALGANRGRIVTQLFVEALVLAMVAAVVALMIVRIFFQQVNNLLEQIGISEFPAWFTFQISSEAVWYLIGLTVFAAVVVGVVPAIQATGKRVHLGLRKVAGGSGMQLGNVWTVLIVVQVAATVALMPLAAGVAWNTGKIGFADHGLATDAVLTASLVTGYYPPQDPAAREDYRREFRARLGTRWNELKSRLEAEPNVLGVTCALNAPGTLSMYWYPFEAEGVSLTPDSPSGLGARSQYNRVDLNFFDFFDIRLLAGRLFSPDDRDLVSRNVIVDRTFVAAVLGDIDAVGQRIRIARRGDLDPAEWFEIVGVVEDFPLNESALMEVRGTVYSATLPTSLGIALRVGSTPAAFSERLREIVTSVDPTLGLSDVLPLDDVYRSRLDRMLGRMFAWTTSLAIISLLFLSTAGIYAMTSFAVTQCRREIGIRVALGAYPHRILGSIFSRAALQLAFGVAFGTVAAVPLVTYWERIDFDGIVLSAPDVPWALFVVAVLIMTVGLAGTVGPAFRGLSVQPADVLKED